MGAASTTYGYFSGTHRLQSLSGSQSKSYTFDAVGNMTSDGTTTWVYGDNNRPVSAGSTTFLINALGQRVKKTTGSSAVRFVYDEAGRLWGEYDAAGTLIQETIWLNDLPVAVLRDNGSGGTSIFYIHPDHLGTPRAVTRASDNQFMWKWDNTEPFGNSTPNDNPGGLGAFAFNLRFPGQYWDSETGKAYNYFRDYDPSIGRYIESDPIGLRGGINTYLYVGARPLTYIDKDGRLSAGGLALGGLGFGYMGCSFWAAAKAAGAGGGDKFKHCYASCLINKCTLFTFGPAWFAGFALEVSQSVHGTGYDSADMDANLYGIYASYRGDCRQECEQCPIK